MKIKNITPIPPKESRCIEVDSSDRLFAVGGETGDVILSHNSVSQQNMILGCVLRPESWRFLGIDLKKVELSSWRAYSNVVLGVATTLEDALTVLRFAQQTMMKRYQELEQLGLKNFTDLPEKGQALLLMVDEMGELLSPSGVKALSGNTIIPTPSGQKTLELLEIGDLVYDNFGKETPILKKYTPVEQERFDMIISSKMTGEKETFVAGSEHNWVAYFTHPDGTVEGPVTVDTKFLYGFKSDQDVKSPEDRISIDFKKG